MYLLLENNGFVPYRLVMGLGRVEGEYYLSPLSVKSGRTRFRVSSFRKS
ncbi:hypothetical protein H1P_2840010 [Hyella patelloides LEGE 07179]|uniref:Uncharacterized protein n=1 Tax=Hyella patelloides LEGE 07179 TaxID=945734 RepID=A0A563VTF6_9CYAN|nr:hypothetical protein H1P_2840010 [Hyella patelloides LEGE 07179]